MVEIIASVALIGGIAGAGSIIARKMPQAVKSLAADRAAFPAGVFAGAKNWIVDRIKRRSSMKDFSWIDFSQKQLLKIRVAVLKVDNKINEVAGKLRQRAEKKRQEEQVAGDNYWQNLKNVVKTGQSASGKKAKSPAAEFRRENSRNSEHFPAVGEAQKEPEIKRVAMPGIDNAAARRRKKGALKGKKGKDRLAR